MFNPSGIHEFKDFFLSPGNGSWKKIRKTFVFQGKVSEAYGNPVDVPLSGSAWFSISDGHHRLLGIQKLLGKMMLCGELKAVRCSDRVDMWEGSCLALSNDYFQNRG